MLLPKLEMSVLRAEAVQAVLQYDLHVFVQDESQPPHPEQPPQVPQPLHPPVHVLLQPWHPPVQPVQSNLQVVVHPEHPWQSVHPTQIAHPFEQVEQPEQLVQPEAQPDPHEPVHTVHVPQPVHPEQSHITHHSRLMKEDNYIHLQKLYLVPNP